MTSFLLYVDRRFGWTSTVNGATSHRCPTIDGNSTAAGIILSAFGFLALLTQTVVVRYLVKKSVVPFSSFPFLTEACCTELERFDSLGLQHVSDLCFLIRMHATGANGDARSVPDLRARLLLRLRVGRLANLHRLRCRRSWSALSRARAVALSLKIARTQR